MSEIAFGRDAVGHLFIQLAWLATRLVEEGTRLRAAIRRDWQSRQDTVSVMHHPPRIRAGRTWKYVVVPEADHLSAQSTEVIAMQSQGLAGAGWVQLMAQENLEDIHDVFPQSKDVGLDAPGVRASDRCRDSLPRTSAKDQLP
jgi:hypothetical protein